MRRVKSEEARRTFRDLLDEAERGGVIEILRYDRPVAVMVSADWYERAAALLPWEAESGPANVSNPEIRKQER